MPTKKKSTINNNNQIVKEVIKQLSTGGVTNHEHFITELAKVNKDKLYNIMNTQPDIEYVLCYAKKHELKYYPNYVVILTYTLKNKLFFLNAKDMLEKLNNSMYIYIERNGGDMVIRDKDDVIVEV